MPKPNKKRTKHYNPTKYLKAPQTFTEASLAQVKEDYRRIELAVELKLHTGQMSREEMVHLHKMVTLVTFCLYAAYGIDSDYCIETYADEWVALQKAVSSLEKRGEKLGHYTATGDEVEAIRNGIQIAGVVLNAALDADPVRVLDIFMVSEDMDDMPAKAVDRVTWLNRKITHYRELRKKCGRLPQVGDASERFRKELR